MIVTLYDVTLLVHGIAFCSVDEGFIGSRDICKQNEMKNKIKETCIYFVPCRSLCRFSGPVDRYFVQGFKPHGPFLIPSLILHKSI